MRKLRIIEHISLDGVIQAPGGRGEDGDYPHGGWTAPFRDPVVGQVVVAAHSQPFDLLLGRRTYDIWSGHWPRASGVLADGINAATKFIATHRPESLEWGPSAGLGPDLSAGVRRIKAAAGPDIITWGSSTLTSTLLDQGLADEVMLFVYPILLGTGKRFFAEGTPPRSFALSGTKSAASGVIINTYTPA